MAYRFREVICPYCQHQFMLRKNEGGMKIYNYFDKKTGRKMYSTMCPQCKEHLYAIEHVLEGIKKDDERVLEKGLMRHGVKDLAKLKTKMDMYNYVHDYDFDEGFEIPAAILQMESCTLQIALQIFWLADGYTYLQDKEGDSDQPEWTAFMAGLYRDILAGKYKVGKLAFDPELNKVQIFKFKKLLSDKEQVFITPIEGK